MARQASFKNIFEYYEHHITPVEVIFMQRFCSLRRICWLKTLFIVASRLGDGPLWVMTAGWLLLTGNLHARMVVASALVAVTISVLTFMAIKNLIGRPRPCESWQSLTCLMSAPDKFSFPSGHSMTAFAVWSSLSSAIAELTLPYLLAAIIIGLSRVFLGLHYPTDVLVGALLGSAIGFATVLSTSAIQSLLAAL
ncbi:MAG: phosphatase PAP2 family protein [Desulfuromonadales bacterium]|nr:phosphatase PAP2 family protein [Desulfuromonadales bacterium]